MVKSVNDMAKSGTNTTISVDSLDADLRIHRWDTFSNLGPGGAAIVGEWEPCDERSSHD